MKSKVRCDANNYKPITVLLTIIEKLSCTHPTKSLSQEEWDHYFQTVWVHTEVINWDSLGSMREVKKY